jgi:hypothetical protein
MDTIQFFIVEYIDEEFELHRSETHIYINGRNLIDMVEQIEQGALNLQNERDSSMRSYAGLNPEWRPNLRNEFLGNTREPYAVVLTCTCHEDWCNSILAKINVDSQTITWRDFTSVLYGEESRSWGGRPIDYSALGPFVFDRKQYLEALDMLALDR